MSDFISTNSSTSTFNEGVFQIQRLHDLWNRSNHYSRIGDLDKWRWILDSIWRELSRDAVRLSNLKVKPEEFHQQLMSNPWNRQWNSFCQEYNLARDHQLRSAQYGILNEMEIFLRTLQDRAGKGGKYKDPNVDSMD